MYENIYSFCFIFIFQFTFVLVHNKELTLKFGFIVLLKFYQHRKYLKPIVLDLVKS